MGYYFMIVIYIEYQLRYVHTRAHCYIENTFQHMWNQHDIFWMAISYKMTRFHCWHTAK